MSAPHHPRHLALLLSLLAISGISAAPPTDPEKLQGVWRGWVVNGKGEKPDQGPVNLEVTVQGDRITAKQLNPGADPNLGEGTFQLTVAAAARTIDATRTSMPGKGQTYAGIYELDGDSWRWCVSPKKGERPTEFVTRKGQFLLILKRQPAK
jgi:uncharacterized protein (TIGR03067 family)